MYPSRYQSKKSKMEFYRDMLLRLARESPSLSKLSTNHGYRGPEVLRALESVAESCSERRDFVKPGSVLDDVDVEALEVLKDRNDLYRSDISRCFYIDGEEGLSCRHPLTAAQDAVFEACAETSDPRRMAKSVEYVLAKVATERVHDDMPAGAKYYEALDAEKERLRGIVRSEERRRIESPSEWLFK